MIRSNPVYSWIHSPALNRIRAGLRLGKVLEGGSRAPKDGFRWIDRISDPPFGLGLHRISQCCFVFFRKVKTKKSSSKSKIQRFYINCKLFLLILASLTLIFALIKIFSIISNFHLRNARFTPVIIVFRYVLIKAS